MSGCGAEEVTGGVNHIPGSTHDSWLAPSERYFAQADQTTIAYPFLNGTPNARIGDRLRLACPYSVNVARQRPVTAPIRSFLHSRRPGDVSAVPAALVFNLDFNEFPRLLSSFIGMVQNLQSCDRARPTSRRHRFRAVSPRRGTCEMKRLKCAGGGDAVVTMNDVWLCLEDLQAVLKQRSRTLQQALDVLRGAGNAKTQIQYA